MPRAYASVRALLRATVALFRAEASFRALLRATGGLLSWVFGWLTSYFSIFWRYGVRHE